MTVLDRHASMVEVVKPAVDKLQYRCITLRDNGIRITLISDPDADKAAAAMDVNIRLQIADTLPTRFAVHSHDLSCLYVQHAEELAALTPVLNQP